MKKKNLNFLLALLAALALVFAGACSDGSDDDSSSGGGNGGNNDNTSVTDYSAFSGKTYTYDAQTSSVSHAGKSSAILDSIEIAFGEGSSTAFTATVYYAAHSSDFALGADSGYGTGGTGHCTFGSSSPGGTCGVFEATFTGSYSVSGSAVTLSSLAVGDGTTADDGNNVTWIILASDESGLTLSGAGDSPAYKLCGTGTTYAYSNNETTGTASQADSIGIDIFADASTEASDSASVGTLSSSGSLKTGVVFTTTTD